MLRYLDETDLAVPGIEGTFAAWSPGGKDARAITWTPARRDGCKRVHERTFEPATFDVDDSWDGRLCGEVTGMVRTTSSTYLSIVDDRPEGSTESLVVRLPDGASPETVFHGVRVLGASDDGDLFLQQLETDRPYLIGTTARVGGGLVRYRAPSGRLILEAFLGMDHARTGALVLGAIGADRGVYRVPGVSQVGEKAPYLVFPTSSQQVSAAESSRGVLILVVDGEVHAVGAEGSKQLALPDGAPAPGDGPIVWLPREDTA